MWLAKKLSIIDDVPEFYGLKSEIISQNINLETKFVPDSHESFMNLINLIKLH